MSKQNKIILWLTIICLVLLASIIIGYNIYQKEKRQRVSIESNLVVLSDSLTTIRFKDSSSKSTILSFTEANKKQLLDLIASDSTVRSLQSLVKNYKGETSSAAVIGSNTHIRDSSKTIVKYIDTMGRDFLQDKLAEYYSDFNLDGWAYGHVIATKDYTKVGLSIKEQYDLVIGKEKGKYYGEITTHNPYDEIKTFRTYNLTVPQKKWNLSIYGGYGFSFNQSIVHSGVTFGIGIGRTILSF